MFWYYVAPFADKEWILFDGHQRPSTYDSANEALKVACKAAEVMRKQQQTATGVRVKLGNDWRDAVKFGG